MAVGRYPLKIVCLPIPPLRLKFILLSSVLLELVLLFLRPEVWAWEPQPEPVEQALAVPVFLYYP